MAKLDLQDCCDYATTDISRYLIQWTSTKKEDWEEKTYFIYKLFIKWISKKYYILLILWYKITKFSVIEDVIHNPHPITVFRARI